MNNELLRLDKPHVTKQIASWLYLDGHPCTEPMKSTDMINREYFREL
ncbi:hypothetical protein LCGC14_1477060, partial [marine sediment metagenome]